MDSPCTFDMVAAGVRCRGKTKSADQFNFATALVDALTGRVPFVGNDPISVVTNIVVREFDPS